MQDIIMTKNGKQVEKIISTKTDKVAAMKSVFEIIPPDVDIDNVKAERLFNKGRNQCSNS